jgi:hypothetical protein
MEVDCVWPASPGAYTGPLADTIYWVVDVVREPDNSLVTSA